MGLFDLPAPLLAWTDQALLGALPPLFRLVLWGLVGSVLSMGLYKLISPQKRIGQLRSAAVDARRRMAAYDGEFSGLGAVAMASLSLSFRHVGAVFFPAVIASLPVICLLAWLSNSYGYEHPKTGEIVYMELQIVATAPPERIGDYQGVIGSHTMWPAKDKPIELSDSAGRPILQLPLSVAVPVIQKRDWWNIFLGNPLGYLPADSDVDEVTITLSPRTYLNVEPAWLGGWEMIFLTVLFVVSVAIKVAFRIH